ncbi:MAG: lipopolysaccharide biosynthesis protein [Bacillota bacterium]
MKKMLTTFFHYFLGTFATRIVQFLFLPIYTTYIATANLGQYDTIAAYVQIFLPVLFQAIWDAILRLGFDKKDQSDRVSFFSTVIPHVGLLSCIYLIIGIILQLFHIKLAIYVALMVATSGLLTVWQNAARAVGNTKAYAASNVISASISIAVNVVLVVFLHMGVEALLLSSIISYFVTAVVVELMIRLRQYIRLKEYSAAILKEVMHYVRHFIVATTFWKLLGLCSPLIIPWLLGYSMNGIYSVALRFQTILSTITLVYNMAWQEEMIRRNEDEQRGKIFNDIYKKLQLLCFGVLFMILPATYLVYPFLVKGDYGSSLLYIPIVFLECILTTLVTHISSVFIMAKDTLANLIDTVSSAVVNIILIIVLGSFFKLYGVAIATVLGAIFRMILCKTLVNKHLKADLQVVRFLLLTAGYAGLVLALRNSTAVLQIALFAAMFAVAVFINKNLIMQVVIAIRKQLGKSNG